MKATLLLLAGVAFAVPGVAFAETVTLSTVRAKALAAHPELVAEDARIVAAEASIREAQSAQKPRISADVDVAAGPGGQIVTIPEDFDDQGNPALQVGGAPALGDDGAFNINGRWSADVGLDWNLYDFGRTASAVRAARWEQRARDAQRAATADALIETVDQAYLDWLDASERGRFRAEALQRSRERLERLASRVDVGAASPSELWPARTDVAALELGLAEAEQVVAESRLALEAAARIELGPDARPDASLLTMGEPAAGLPSGPADRTVAALEARIRSAEAEAKKHQRERHPELVGSLRLGLRGQVNTVFPNYRAGIGFQVPIWEGGEIAARVDEAEARARELRARRDDAAAERDRELDRHQLALRSSRRRVELAARFVEVAEGRLEDLERRPEGDPERAEALDRARAERDRALEAWLSARVDRAWAALRLSDGAR